MPHLFNESPCLGVPTQSHFSTDHTVRSPYSIAVFDRRVRSTCSIDRIWVEVEKRGLFIFRTSSCDEGSQTLTPQTRISVAVGQRVSEAAVPEPVTPEPGNLRVSFFSGRALKSLTLARSCTLHPQLRRTSRALRSGLVLLGSKDANSTRTSGRSIPLSSTCSSGEGNPSTRPQVFYRNPAERFAIRRFTVRRFRVSLLHQCCTDGLFDTPSIRNHFPFKTDDEVVFIPNSRRDHPEDHPREFFVESSQPAHRQSSTMGTPEETDS